MINPAFYASSASQAYNSLRQKGMKNQQDVEAKNWEKEQAKANSQVENAKLNVTKAIAEMNHLEEQAAKIQKPEKQKALNRSEAGWAGGLAALASLLGAHQPAVQNALQSYIGGKQNQESQNFDNQMGQYQGQLQGIDSAMNAKMREMQLLQGQVKDYQGDADTAGNRAFGLRQAATNRDQELADRNAKYAHDAEMQKPSQVEEVLSLAQQLQMADPTLTPAQALQQAAQMRLSPAANVATNALTNQTRVITTDKNNQTKTGIAAAGNKSRYDIAKMNADARIKAAGISASSGERRAAISGEYGLLKQGMANEGKSNEDVKAIRTEIAGIDKDINESQKNLDYYQAIINRVGADPASPEYIQAQTAGAAELKNLDRLRKTKAQWVQRAKALKAGGPNPGN